MLGKKSLETSAKQGFVYSHEYRDKKMGGRKPLNKFPETHE